MCDRVKDIKRDFFNVRRKFDIKERVLGVPLVMHHVTLYVAKVVKLFGKCLH